MSAPWWGKEAEPRNHARLAAVPPKGDEQGVPALIPASAGELLAELRGRIPAFTPEWTNLHEGDAGVALVRLFGSELGPLLERVNRLSEKSLVELLRLAGVESRPASPARVLVELAASDGAPEAPFAPRGFQLGAAPADGGEPVIFETEDDLWVAPAEIAEIYTRRGRRLVRRDDAESGAAFLPFGRDPRPGRALVIGLAGDVAPGPVLTIGLGVAAAPGAPPPVAAGSLTPLPVPPPPLLAWEVLDNASFEPAEVLVDETAGLARSGVVRLRLPRRFRPGRPAGTEGDGELRWLRLRLAHGRFAEPPRLAFVCLNVVRATAARSIRGEAVEAVPGSSGRRRLAQTPVVPSSLVLEVDEGVGGGDLFTFDGTPQETGSGGVRRWREVPDLSSRGPHDRVYTLDPVSGEISFGDGVHGVALPPGFRHVTAVVYQVGGGAAGAAPAEAVKNLVSSAPFVNGVTNRLPASGGRDAEPLAETLRRGSEAIRSRGRAVTPADYELAARQAPGADIVRAHAVAGHHPAYPGARVPGVVGVFVVPPLTDEGPPLPDSETLRAVAEQLSRELAPAGVDVVAAAPRYHRVRAEVAVVAQRGGDAAATVRRVLEQLDLYFDPFEGGADGEGWPFGAPLRWAAIVRRLQERVPEVVAVPRLNLVVEGFRVLACNDHPISANGLLWPDGHQVVLAEGTLTPDPSPRGRRE